MNKETRDIVARVHEAFKTRGMKLSVAESCTGGLICHRLTELPGASLFFEAGVVSYSASSKQDLLGVSAGTISSTGVISAETAKEMAERMRNLAGTDYAVATTGNLGPGVLEEKKKGRVYTAVASAVETAVREDIFEGEREAVKEKAALAGLRFLLGVIEAGT